MEKLFAQLPKGSISEIIIDRITEALIVGDLKPGDKIPTEMEFSEKLGVSRNGVREAIKVLVAFGVLEIRRAEGTFVVEEYNQNLLDPMLYGLILKERSMEELIETKLAMATSMLYLAIMNATDDQIAQLRAYGEEFRRVMHEKPSNIENMYQASRQFNEYLSTIGNNRMMNQMDSIIFRIATFTRHKAMAVSVERDILDALPDNYMEEVEILERRDRNAVIPFMDKRLKLWQELLL